MMRCRSRESMDTDIHNQPTWHDKDIVQEPLRLPGRIRAVVPARLKGLSRRKLFGITAVGLGAAAVGGVALEQWWQHSGFNGAMADNVQLGHLLRRAGFGANPEELAVYRGLGLQGAVDRLIN